MLPLLLLGAALSCPVLSTASVAGVFGEVQASVKKAEKGMGVTCEFRATEHQLKVEVSELRSADKFADFAATQCQGGRDSAPVRAIGNEATACRIGTGGNVVEKVVGRVRNQAFVLALNTTGKVSDAGSLRTKIIGLSEQVAGNLF
jgi:hypothetical protein